MTNIVISNFRTGFETNREPINIANDAFEELRNAYLYRGRIIKKNGTQFLARLQRNLVLEAFGNTDGAGVLSANIKTFFSLETNSEIAIDSITVTIGAQVFTETSLGVLSNGGAGTGTINYITGAIVVNTDPVLAGAAVVISFSYYPSLPVMGLKDFETPDKDFPDLVAFDTKYSYEIDQGLVPEQFFDVNFYKISRHPFIWTGQDYQQFYTESYFFALWATNGNPGFHFLNITTVTTGATTTITTSVNHDLTDNDWVFLNEINMNLTAPPNTLSLINGQGFQVTVTGLNTFTVAYDSSAETYVNSGIVQLLTKSLNNTIDGIRWYDGKPTAFAPSPLGWVNFAPPLSAYDPILNPHPQYLIGADQIQAFKNRLLFFGVTTAPSNDSGVYFANRMIYSQNGTPFYTLPVPLKTTAQKEAWYQNVPARGGFLGAPVPEKIYTVSEVDDVLIVGLDSSNRKLIFTADDSIPFIYQAISSQVGTNHIFSAIAMEDVVYAISNYGIIATTQIKTVRADLQIPDEVFDIALTDNAEFRVTAVRDYRNEFLYFTFYSEDSDANNTKFPNKTIVYKLVNQNLINLND